MKAQNGFAPHIRYLFWFVPDSADAVAFDQAILGLNAIEGVHCCNPACPPEKKGIAKYDVGGLLLTTHQSIAVGW